MRMKVPSLALICAGCVKELERSCVRQPERPISQQPTWSRSRTLTVLDLAWCYGEAPINLLRRAGYVQPGDDLSFEEYEIIRAYNFAVSDPRISPHHIPHNLPTTDEMELVVRIYEQFTGKRLIDGEPRSASLVEVFEYISAMSREYLQVDVVVQAVPGNEAD
jgi:hypothetical protein